MCFEQLRREKKRKKKACVACGCAFLRIAFIFRINFWWQDFSRSIPPRQLHAHVGFGKDCVK